MSLSNLDSSELIFLLKKYIRLANNTHDREIYKVYSLKILTIKRELARNYDNKYLVYTEYNSRNSTNVKNLCNNLLSKLGYTQNTLFKQECEYISDRICRDFGWNQRNTPHGKSYSNEAISTCIVGEVLEYYNSNYNERNLIDIYNIPINTFIKLSISTHSWCLDNYWSKNK